MGFKGLEIYIWILVKVMVLPEFLLIFKIRIEINMSFHCSTMVKIKIMKNKKRMMIIILIIKKRRKALRKRNKRLIFP